MARRKEQQSDKKRRQRTRKPRNDKAGNSNSDGRGYEISGVVIAAAALICLCGLFNFNVGYVGLYFAKVSRYLFGIGVWPVLIMALAWGWCTARDHQLFPDKVKTLGAILALVSVCAVLHNRLERGYRFCEY